MPTSTPDHGSAGPGLKILGGPRGEGLGLLVAREVGERIEGGAPPEEILILVPRLDEDAERIREALASWGLPVSAGPGRRLSTVPAISALRLGAGCRPSGGRSRSWSGSSGTARSDGRGGPRLDLRPARGRLGDPRRPGSSATASRSGPALAATLDRKPKDRPTLAALDALDRLSAWIDPVARPGPWRVQVDRLRRLADSLGLDRASWSRSGTRWRIGAGSWRARPGGRGGDADLGGFRRPGRRDRRRDPGPDAPAARGRSGSSRSGDAKGPGPGS